MKPLIFLDFDGVLNSWRWFLSQGAFLPTMLSQRERERIGFDPQTVARLNALIERTGASVVISSAWRRCRTTDELQSLLESQGFIGKIIGKTPKLRGPRAREIASWLRLTGQLDRPHIVIDDNSIGMGSTADAAFSGVGDPRYIETSIHSGLQDLQLEQAALTLEDQKTQ